MNRWLIVPLPLAAALALAYFGSEHFLKTNRPLRPALRQAEAAEASPTDAVQGPEPDFGHSSVSTVAMLRPAAPTPIETQPKAEGSAAPRSVDHEPKATVTDEERKVYAASVFDSELFDPTWAPTARKDIESKLAPVPKPASVRVGKVECRRELCRFEVEALEGEGTAFLHDAIRTNLGAGMAIRNEPDSAGRILTTIYVAPKGTPLPEPQPE